MLDHQTVISHHFQSAAIFRLKNLPGPSGFTEVFVCCLYPSKLASPWGCCWGCPCAEQPAFRKLLSAAVPGRWVLHHLLLFDTGNEPRRKKRGENDGLRNVCELCCCVSPVLQWSSFSLALFLTISASLFFCSSPLVPTPLKLSLIEDSRSFYFGRRKDGKSSMQATHEWKTHFFYFFF